ncbi:hypothetical protein [Vallitalea guaymasensis]|uniref:hypothetical protein n=1 Tax=Vallitalea guaymasensis TaxID=1185412 RepID=UPI0023560C9C|nr:hypothetical protein [Vallitalea guaymasensis]
MSIVLFLAIGILLINHNATIAKNNSIASEAREYIDEQKAKEIAISYFQKYFDIKIIADDYFQYNRYINIDNKHNKTGKEYWEIVFSTFDRSKLRDIKTQEEADKINEERKKSVTYYAKIDIHDEEILEIGIIDNDNNKGLTIEELRDIEISTEDAKKITLEFIKAKELIKEIEELEFLGEIRIAPDSCYIAYEYKKDRAIIIRVNSLSQEVSCFRFTTKEQAEKAIEVNKNNDKDGGIG